MPAPLTGDIPITNGQGIVPPGSWFMIGEDGEVYTVSGSQGISPNYAKVGSASTNATIWTLTAAQWAIDFNALGLAGVPATGAGGAAQGPVPIPGTAYFYHCGKSGGGADEWSIGVRYKIVSPASVVVDGGFAYKNSPSGINGILGNVWCYGCGVVDGELFAVVWLYNGIFDPQPGTYLIRLPLGFGTNIIDGTNSAWVARRTYVGNRFGDNLGVSTYFNAPTNFSIVGMLKHPANATTVMILTYRPQDTLPGSGSGLLTGGSEYVLVDWNAQTTGLLTSAQSELGQPWPDIALGYYGTPTSNNGRNDYCGPTVGDGGGATQREVMFSRMYVDEPTFNQTRRFVWDEVTGLFTPVDVVQWTVETGQALDFASLAYRYAAAGQLVGGARYNTSIWRLGQYSNPPIGGLPGRRFVGKLGPVRTAV